MRDYPRIFLRSGFVALVCILAFIAYQAQQRMNLARTEILATLDSSNGKNNAARKLRHAVVEHGKTVRDLLASDDELERAEMLSSTSPANISDR